jgi:FkbM family methyltransferase
MAGKIWYYDAYDLRKFRPGDIDYFIDIGANVGTTTLMAKLLNPTARVIAIEPCKETFEILVVNMKQWMNTGIECYNLALGDGKPMCFQRRRRAGLHRFFANTDEERHWWPEKENFEYTIESKSLNSMFADYDVPLDSNYIVKIDCEGGERFLLNNDERDIDIIKSSVQVMMELHRGLGGTTEEWNEWLTQFRDTHELLFGHYIDKHTTRKRFEFFRADEIPDAKGFVALELVKRDWAKFRMPF